MLLLGRVEKVSCKIGLDYHRYKGKFKGDRRRGKRGKNELGTKKGEDASNTLWITVS